MSLNSVADEIDLALVIRRVTYHFGSHLLFGVDLQELVHQHVASTRLDNKLVIHNFDRDLLGAKLVLAFFNAGSRNEEFARVQSLGHEHVDFIVLNRLVLNALGFDICVQLQPVLLLHGGFFVLSFFDFVFKLINQCLFILDHLVKLVALICQRLQFVVVEAELIFVDLDFFVKLCILELDLLNLALDLLAHLFLLQDVALGEINRNLDALDILPD